MTFLRAKRFLRSLVSRNVELKTEEITRLSTRARFLSDAELELRILAARDLLGVTEPKADRKKPADPAAPLDYEKDLGAL